jgi:hypothetical protein
MTNGWIQNIPALLPLQPGKTLDVTLPIQPPRQPDSRATRYPFILRVRSQNKPTESVDTRCALTILPFTQFTSRLQPQRLKSGETGRIIIQNLGNVVETFTITLIDQSEELVFFLSESKLRIQEGKSESLEFSARTRKSQWMGGEKKYPFTVNVAIETKPGSSISMQPAPQVHPGELVSKGRLAAWLDVKIL